MESKNKFVRGFKVAYQEFSLKLITGGSICTLILTACLSCSFLEWAYVILFLTMMHGIEFFNTSIEWMVDIVSPEYHDYAKVAKDCGSAAQMLFDFCSFTGVGMILVPKILEVVGVL